MKSIEEFTYKTSMTAGSARDVVRTSEEQRSVREAEMDTLLQIPRVILITVTLSTFREMSG